jgi:hypothetical protein
LVGRAILLT